MAQVLVIDDDSGTLETFGLILSLAGHTPVLAATGEEGLRFARSSIPELVLTDLRLPDMDGIELIKRLRLALVPFVVMTAFPSTESALEAGRLGVIEYVAKPLFHDDLLRIVTSYVRQPGPHVAFSNRLGTLESSNPHVIRTLNAIESGYADADMNVASLAKSLNVSAEHLCRLLKQHTGHAFHTCLLYRRIRETRHLLETTTLSIKEIATAVGFRGTSNLDHLFKATCGASSKQYRQSALVSGHLKR